MVRARAGGLIHVVNKLHGKWSDAGVAEVKAADKN